MGGMTHNFDESKVLRGQPKNKAQFRSNPNGEPETMLPAMPATMQTDKPIKHMTLPVGNRTAREWVRRHLENECVTDQPYQRPSVWTKNDQQMLVKSFLSGLPIPAIVVNDRHNAKWTGDRPTDFAIIDGKQRLEAATAWYNDDLDVPASWFDPDWVETTFETEDGPYIKHSGLTPTGQRIFSNRAMLPTIEVCVDTIEEEAEIFLVLNRGGVAQTEETLANAEAVANGVKQAGYAARHREVENTKLNEGSVLLGAVGSVVRVKGVDENTRSWGDIGMYTEFGTLMVGEDANSDVAVDPTVRAEPRDTYEVPVETIRPGSVLVGDEGGALVVNTVERRMFTTDINVHTELGYLTYSQDARLNIAKPWVG